MSGMVLVSGKDVKCWSVNPNLSREVVFTIFHPLASMLLFMLYFIEICHDISSRAMLKVVSEKAAKCQLVEGQP